MEEIRNCPIFVAENGKVVHISADSDTKIVNKMEIPFRRVGKWKLSI